jgi:hypothetical protein
MPKNNDLQTGFSKNDVVEKITFFEINTDI